MSGLPCDWNAIGSKVAGYNVLVTRRAKLLQATRVIYRALKISPNTARKAARALEREGLLRAVFRVAR